MTANEMIDKLRALKSGASPVLVAESLGAKPKMATVWLVKSPDNPIPMIIITEDKSYDEHQ